MRLSASVGNRDESYGRGSVGFSLSRGRPIVRIAVFALAVCAASLTPVWEGPDAGAAASALKAAPAEAAGGAAESKDSTGLLVVSRTLAVSGCGAEFVSPGASVQVIADGFAASASVTLEARAASLSGTALPDPVLANATADSQGRVTVDWTVPSAPAAGVDAAPRMYAVRASGANSAGGTHTAYSVAPVIAYPGTTLCAKPDSATTSLGASVRINVLMNDVAPTGGSLDAASVEVRAAAGGVFEADASGAVTFTPAAGFWGTARTTYTAYDGWGIGVDGDLTVTVNPGCTVTGTVGVALIEGTSGDDVLCVPDPDDWLAFHIMDGKGGDDVILGGDGEEWIYGGDGADTVYAAGGDDFIVAGAGVDTIYGGVGEDEIHSVDTADAVIDDTDGYELVLAPAVVMAPQAPTVQPDWHYASSSAPWAQIDVLSNDRDLNGDLDASSLRIVSQPSSGLTRLTDAADGGRAVEYLALPGTATDSFSYEVCDFLNACATAEVTVMLATAVCTIIGTEGRDSLRGTSGDDVICGLGGDDIILGFGGDDILIGGDGDDVFAGSDGDDIVWGGPGDDMAWGGNGDDSLWGGPGDDLLHANAGNDHTHTGPGDDQASGGAGDDSLWGGLGADNLVSGDGDDLLGGGDGSDTLWGGGGGDTMWGGPGNDTLDGSSGDDVMFGGFGSDTLHGGSGTDYMDGGHNILADTRLGDTDTCERGETTRQCVHPDDVPPASTGASADANPATVVGGGQAGGTAVQAADADASAAPSGQVWIAGASPAVPSGNQPAALSALVLEGTGVTASGPSYAGLGHPRGNWSGSSATDAVADGWGAAHAGVPRLIWQLTSNSRYSPFLPSGLNLILPVGHSLARSGTWKLEARTLGTDGNYAGAWRPLPDVTMDCRHVASGVRYRFVQNPFWRPPGGIITAAGPVVHCTSADSSSADALFTALVDYNLPGFRDPASVARFTYLGADEFEIAVPSGIDPISRAGRHTEMSLQLTRDTGMTIKRGDAEPIPVIASLADTPAVGSVTAGPSRGAKLMCRVPSTVDVPSPGYTSTCVTDATGRISARYWVPPQAAHALRRGRDTLQIYLDHDGDGKHDSSPGAAGHEAAASLDIDIAKSVKYVALGDSYSSGEQGKLPDDGSEGNYENDANSADTECRRWDRAYPYVFAQTVLERPLLNIDVDFTTFACTGAITHNIYDPSDSIATRQPSKHAPAVGATNWEPRQAVSLNGIEIMNDVDMITLTIGGNDADFAGVVEACATTGCGAVNLGVFDMVENRVTEVLQHLKTVAPVASVFVLGYAPITPEPTPCPSGRRDCPELGQNSYIDECRALESVEIIAHTADIDVPLWAHLLPGVTVVDIYSDVFGFSISRGFKGRLKIDHIEASHLWNAATRLNTAVRKAAAAAGAHFVDIATAASNAAPRSTFVGHSPCSAEPWLHGYAVETSNFVAASGMSFHPNAAGHRAYARLLEQYISGYVTAETLLNSAGIPVNPAAK